MRLPLLLLAATAVTVSNTEAQFPPTKLTNLKYFSKKIPVRSLVDSMRYFTRALGVRCQFCHVAGKEPNDLNGYDFASDEKVAKVKARTMLKMVGSINKDQLRKLASRVTPELNVTCMTCHRGVSQPRPIEQIVLAAHTAGGIDSAEAVYRALRQRYYGSAAYDFGEVPLADAADALRTQGKGADAIRLHLLNTSLLPSSGFAHRQAAGAYLAAGDTTSAVSMLEKALTINANDRQAQQLLAAIKAKRGG
ncbi:MAG TPA: c-type cytochrome [Gemmatimonadales bacterium]|nr:c-type cytochrome [Gemmatimonadales bacterium]